ncbi:MAG: tRNA (adenosine(37)-N6)-dimethylallyltransferase MiaA [Ruminococcaceae bacterium]|nr:tRNA (adenosine(37)-N6)-dimethylallyltransferase MiaA [Oscillospiraceae bacterium]
MNEFIAVTGATASGKTSLSVELAARLDTEIISCDSMQIYKGMDVGTAKPDKEEMKGIPHHMLDVISPDTEFSAGDYATMAGEIIDGIIEKGKIPVMCGGTFLYLDTLTTVSSLSDATKDEELRAELEAFAAENGNTALHNMLREIDPEAADAIHANNVKRVIRAIEIFRTTGKTKTEWDALSKEKEPPYKAHIIVIDYHNREILYDRINRRVEIMMEAGLEAEAKDLFDRGLLEKGYCAAQAIGYKEFIPYFKGECSLDLVVTQIKQSSRNYAKRQLTWLRRYENAIRVFGDTEDGEMVETKILADEIMAKLKADNVIQ